jgi:hypothetical protein
VSEKTVMCDVCSRAESPECWNDRIARVVVGDATVDVCSDCVTMGRVSEVAGGLAHRVEVAAREEFGRRGRRPRGSGR